MSEAIEQPMEADLGPFEVGVEEMRALAVTLGQRKPIPDPDDPMDRLREKVHKSLLQLDQALGDLVAKAANAGGIECAASPEVEGYYLRRDGVSSVVRIVEGQIRLLLRAGEGSKPDIYLVLPSRLEVLQQALAAWFTFQDAIK